MRSKSGNVLGLIGVVILVAALIAVIVSGGTAVQIALLSGMVIVSVALNVYLVTGKRRRR